MAALVALVGSGCQRSDGSADEFVTRNDEVPMKISVTMRGEREVTIVERTVPTKFVLFGEGDPNVTPLLGVQPVEPILEGNVRVTPGFTLKPFTGNGRYTIQPGTPREDALNPDKAKAGSGSVRVEWWPVDGEPFEYLRRAKPCTAKVEEDGMKGRLQCPDLTHEAAGGPHFSLDFRWAKA